MIWGLEFSFFVFCSNVGTKEVASLFCKVWAANTGFSNFADFSMITNVQRFFSDDFELSGQKGLL